MDHCGLLIIGCPSALPPFAVIWRRMGFIVHLRNVNIQNKVCWGWSTSQQCWITSYLCFLNVGWHNAFNSAHSGWSLIYYIEFPRGLLDIVRENFATMHRYWKRPTRSNLKEKWKSLKVIHSVVNMHRKCKCPFSVNRRVISQVHDHKYKKTSEFTSTTLFLWGIGL